MSRLALPAVILWCLWLAAPAAAQGVRRCTDARGNSVFTDRSCDSQDAVPSEGARSGFGTGNYGDGAYGPATAGSYASGFGRIGCARSPGRLLDGVRASIQARDVNRLASYYHWTGTGSRSGVHLMDRLEEIVARPLVSAELLYPFASPPLAGFAPAVPAPEGAYRPGSAAPGYPAPGVRPAAGAAYPMPTPAAPPADAAAAPADPGQASITGQPPNPPTSPNPPGPPPYALLLEQMAGDNDAGSHQTRFSLQRNAGCWWVEL